MFLPVYVCHLSFVITDDFIQASTQLLLASVHWDTTIMHLHYNDVIISTIASQITSLTIVYSTVYSGVDQRKHQSFASLAFVRGIHRGPVNSPHKGPVTRKMFPFHDVITKPQQNERHYADHMFRYIFWGSNWQHISIGSGNGLALIGQQGITSINVD